jgi:phospholipase/carboxylesterase
MNMDLQTGNSLQYRASPSPPSPRRLLILSHGVGGNEMNLALLAARAPVDTVVILVRAPLTIGPGQFAWFPVSFSPQGPRPDLAAAEDSRQRLALFVAEMQAAYRVAPIGTVVAGFSQGGIISASVALTQPEIVVGFGVLAGRILPEIEPRLADRRALSLIQGFIGHGRDDTKLPADWAHRAHAWLTDLGVPHETNLYAGDHEIPQAMQDDFFDWLQRITE